ncbi:MAG: WD40 repeat domain-containing serine/threonine-protein kinase [Pirellulaceae bacterium]
MTRPSDSDLIHPSAANPTLDEAIEHCVLALERGETDIESLPLKFPEWKSEIEEFLANWGGMEHLAVGLSDSMELAPSLVAEEDLPRRFGDFELLQKIGAGGMGSIYKARQKSLDRFVAIKILRRDPGEAGRFRMEAEAAATLAHPNIVSIYEVGITDNSPWLCMQYVEGPNLKQYIDNQAITPEEAVRLTRIIALAVNHAHQRGVLHRDLKPANVLMDTNGQPYVTDFGLAKLIKHDKDVTQSGTILGTPGYMSPEQAAGRVRNLTVATDVYGLGALLYALLTGDAPFTGDSSIQILRRVVDEPVTSPRFKNTDVDRDLETICLKCLEKSPELRYHSAEALADDLGRYLDGQPVFARPVSGSERFVRWCQRNPAVAGLSGAVIVLMIATTLFAGFLAWSERNLRVMSDENTRREFILRKEATVAYEDEKIATQNALKTQINLLTTNALWQAKYNNVGEALLWFTEAATLSEGDSDQMKKTLVNCQSWLNQHPVPVAAMLLSSDYREFEDEDGIQFHPHKEILMYRSNASVVVWDYKRERQWHLKETLPDLTTAIWGSGGKSILAGCSDGRVVSVDMESRQIEIIARVTNSVSHLVLLDQERKLGVVTGKELSVFELESGSPVGVPMLHERIIANTSANRDGSRLVVTDYSKKATVYAADRGGLRKIREQRCFFSSILDIHRKYWPLFVKDEKALLIRTSDFDVMAFDLETGASLGQVGFTYPIHSYSISADGNRALSGGFNRARLIQLGEITPAENEGTAQLKVIHDEQVLHEERVSAVSVRSDGLFATGGWNNEVRLWMSRPPQPSMNRNFDLPEKVVPLAILPHQNRLRRIQFTPDGSFLVTIQIDGLVRLWKIPEFKPAGTSLTVEPGGSLVKAVDADRWMTSGMSHWKGHMANATSYFFADGNIAGGPVDQSMDVVGHLLDSASSPDCTQLATTHAASSRTGLGAGWLRFWTMPDGKQIGEAIPMPSEPRWVDYRSDDRQLAVCTSRMDIVLVNTETREIEGTLDTYGEGKNRLVNSLLVPQNLINERAIYTPDGSMVIAYSTRHRGLGIWDVEHRRLKFPRLHTDQPPLAGIAISPDGKHLAMAGGQSMMVTIIDLETGVFLDQQFPHPSFVHSVEFSPDGNQILTGCRDGHARLFNWRSGEILLDQLNHDADIIDATFTPDSRFLLTLGLDNQLRVWHGTTGNLATRPIVVPAGSSQMLVASDSKHVVVAGGHILNVDLGELQREPKITLSLARQLGEILSNKTIVNGEPLSLSSQDWMARWQDYSAR